MIKVKGAREHNLQNLNLEIPVKKLIAVTGISGSGKSSLAFDTIFKEAQRRYLETFSNYARLHLGKAGHPEVDEITGLSPALSVSQVKRISSKWSTAGTLTALYDDLRMLFSRFPDSNCETLTSASFSFNKVEGACPFCNGTGEEVNVDPELLVLDSSKTLRQGCLVPTTDSGYIVYSQVTIDVLDDICITHGFDVDTPWNELSDENKKVIFYGSKRLVVPYGKHTLESRMKWKGITAAPRKEGYYRGIATIISEILQKNRSDNILRFAKTTSCSVCDGYRLNQRSLAVTVMNTNIGECADKTIERLYRWVVNYELYNGQAVVNHKFISSFLGSIKDKLNSMIEMGLSHIKLSRLSSTLSPGEIQRLKLATEASGKMTNLLYVFDEPGAGLHSVEIRKVFALIKSLVERGNTVFLIEHNPSILLDCDWCIDIGPGGGKDGGNLLFNGSMQDFLSSKGPSNSPTRTYLRSFFKASYCGTNFGKKGKSDSSDKESKFSEYEKSKPSVVVSCATLRNLKKIDVKFYEGKINIVTGVSGAGKTTLISKLIAKSVSSSCVFLSDSVDYKTVAGSELEIENFVKWKSDIGRVVEVSQKPLGRNSRSNCATYTGLFDVIRKLFAATDYAKNEGFTASYFSFNVKSGRCSHCEGAGTIEIPLQLLSSSYVICSHCNGRRFKEDVLGVIWKGFSIDEILDMSIADALPLFEGSKKAYPILKALNDLGLGYLTLGQPSPTVSGGEAQRIKLATELAKKSKFKTLYVLDEPTTGLHHFDVMALADALREIADSGNTVLLADHNLDLISRADHIIDLGPGGGIRGGHIVVSGDVSDLINAKAESQTGRVLFLHNEKRVDFGPSIPNIALARLIVSGELKHARQREQLHNPHDDRTDNFRRTRIGCSTQNVSEAQRGGRRRANLRSDLRESINRFSSASYPLNSQLSGVRLQKHRRGISRDNHFVLKGIKTNNLKNIDFFLPKGKLTVLTGLSGSGKSSLAFDSLYSEARRRFTESLSSYARRFMKSLPSPDIDEVHSIGPVVALGQQTKDGGKSGSERSTVSTMTGIDYYLRLLYSRYGGSNYTLSHFSFNHPLGSCPHCDGLGYVSKCTENTLIYDRDLSVFDGGLVNNKRLLWYIDETGQHRATLKVIALVHNLDFDQSVDSMSEKARKIFFYGTGEQTYDVKWEYERSGKKHIHDFTTVWKGVCHLVEDEYLQYIHTRKGKSVADLIEKVDCSVCDGLRLKEERLWIQWNGLSLEAVLENTVLENLHLLKRVFKSYTAIDDGEKIILSEIVSRLQMLSSSGLSYLTLMRSSKTLSTGEYRRVEFSAQMTRSLSGVTIILDEPTLGLHPKDIANLIKNMKKLRDEGNTLLVIEHNPQVWIEADHIIELGPGGGTYGGKLLFEGSAEKLKKAHYSPSGRVLRQLDSRRWKKRCFNKDLSIDLSSSGINFSVSESDSEVELCNLSITSFNKRKKTIISSCTSKATEVVKRGGLFVDGANAHNLKSFGFAVEKGKITAITGVSGAGKSTLLFDVIEPSLRHKRNIGCKGVSGFENFDFVVSFSKLPLFTAYTTPVSRLGISSIIYSLFADTPQAKRSKFKAARFSAGGKAGQCPVCKGTGLEKVSMDFLGSISSTCSTCEGLCFEPETLMVMFRGLNIGQLLKMTCHDAVKFFDQSEDSYRRNLPSIELEKIYGMPYAVELSKLTRANKVKMDKTINRRCTHIYEMLKIMEKAGLGYIPIGRSLSTLSGGELQRLQLASAIGLKNGGGLFLLDEPARGLHPVDVECLIDLLHRLVKSGSTVCMVEHSIQMINCCDNVVELGPVGGPDGGYLIREEL